MLLRFLGTYTNDKISFLNLWKRQKKVWKILEINLYYYDLFLISFPFYVIKTKINSKVIKIMKFIFDSNISSFFFGIIFAM